jgi:hypothetical protein
MATTMACLFSLFLMALAPTIMLLILVVVYDSNDDSNSRDKGDDSITILKMMTAHNHCISDLMMIAVLYLF